MQEAAIEKDKSANVTIVKKMKDYGKEPAFKKKAEKTNSSSPLSGGI